MLRTSRLALVLVLTLTVQTTWASELRPFGVTGDLLLLVTIATGMSGGPFRGAAVGFIAGMMMDLVLLTPFGLSALAYLTAGYVAGAVNAGVLRSAPWIPVTVSAVCTILGLGLFVVLGQLLGQQIRDADVVRVIGITALMNAAAVIPAMAVTSWVERAGPREVGARW